MITGQAFLTLAGKLAVFSGEPEWRTSISRAYYGAYHHARDFLESKLKVVCIRNSDAHDQVCKSIHHSGHSGLKVVASILATLRSMRNGADYDVHLDQPGQQLKAKTAVAIATEVVTVLDSVVDLEDLSAAQGSIKAAIQSRLLIGIRISSDLR